MTTKKCFTYRRNLLLPTREWSARVEYGVPLTLFVVVFFFVIILRNMLPLFLWDILIYLIKYKYTHKWLVEAWSALRVLSLIFLLAFLCEAAMSFLSRSTVVNYCILRGQFRVYVRRKIRDAFECLLNASNPLILSVMGVVFNILIFLINFHAHPKMAAAF